MLEITDTLKSNNVKSLDIFSKSNQNTLTHYIHKIYCYLVIYLAKRNYAAWGNMELNDKTYFSSMNCYLFKLCSISTDNV